MNQYSFAIRCLLTLTLLMVCAASKTRSVRAEGILDEEGRLVQFGRDIAPIFVAKCLECHGPKDAKNDFRVDDRDTLFMYVEAGDLEGSSLFVDYLVTDDADMQMPPRAHGGPLQPSELAMIRLWIEEGAHWPNDFAMVAGDALKGHEAPQAAASNLERPSLLARVWAFQGYLHPAAVHFPIALLLVGGLFVVLGWKWPAIGTQVPLACLWLGAPAAVATTLMGWSFATEQGYGSWNNFDTTTEVFWHRWSAVFITVLAVISTLVSFVAVKRNDRSLSAVWRTGLLACAALIGLVGHQGGELTYGKAFYQRAFDRLLDRTETTVPTETITQSEANTQSAAERNIAEVTEVKSSR